MDDMMTNDEIEALLGQQAPSGQMSNQEIESLISGGETFGQSVASDVSKRAEAIGQTVEQAAMGNPLAQKAGGVQILGQVAGGVWDVLGEGISRLATGAVDMLPDDIEESFKTVMEEAGLAFMNSDAGKMALQALNEGQEIYGKFKEEYPQTAKTLESFVNIGLLVAPPKVKAEAPPSKLKTYADNLEEKAAKQTVEQRQKFTEELIRPERTKAVKEAEVARTVEVGKGPFKKDVVQPSKREQEIAREVARIEGVKANQSLQKNYNEISKRNQELIDSLSESLKRSTISIPRAQYAARLEKTADDVISTNPVIVGNAATTTKRVKDKAIEILDSKPATPIGVLNARQELDAWVRMQKGEKIFDPVSENALSIALREIRDTMNQIVDEMVPKQYVRNRLRQQSNLYRAMDNIGPKAAKEANTAILRAWQNAVAILPFRGEFNQSLAAILGVGGLGAAAMIAPYFTAGLAITAATYGGGKLIMSPGAKKGVAALVKMLDRAIGTSSNPSTIKQLRIDRAALIELLQAAETQEQ